MTDTADRARGRTSSSIWSKAWTGRAALAPLAPRMLADLGVRFTGVTAKAMAVTNDKPLTKRCCAKPGLATPDWAVPPDWARAGRPAAGSSRRRWKMPRWGWTMAAWSAAARCPAARGRLRGALRRLLVRGTLCRGPGVQYRGAGRTGGCCRWRKCASSNGPRASPASSAMTPNGRRIPPAGAARCAPSASRSNEPELAAKLKSACERVWKLFALSGFARVDFRVAEDGTPLILEINTNPCISPDAGFAAAAEEAGMTLRRADRGDRRRPRRDT